ncbi:MAG TPA: hypothetical protein VFZ66_06060 [Herpetosiphonaceae bacterium]
MKTYRLNATGRRATLLLMLGALAVWLFTLWKLPDILSTQNVTVSYLRLPSTLGAAIRDGLTASQVVPALLFGVLIVAAPLLLWNLLEEWSTTYVVRDDGLLYDTVQGISVLYPWTAIKGLRQVDPESNAPVHELIVDDAGICQIRSRVLRWLHRQAFGRSRIPIYAHVADRDELIAAIVARAGLQLAR